jgi:signal transduction histidine kinase
MPDERSSDLPPILVVDDNAENRALARATLEDEGYEVVAAEDGAEGLEAFKARHPGCVLLDVRMPGMDGLECARRIRELPGGEHVSIVFLTALRDVETFDSAREAGGDDFLTKPVRPSELLSRVQAAIKLSRLAHDVREQHSIVRQQRDAMQRLQLQKERLMAYIVHDLKNPLSGLDMYAQLLLRDPALGEKARRRALQIRDAAASLNRLVMNLVDLAKSDEGTLQPRAGTIDLEKLFDELSERHGPGAEENEVRLSFSATKIPIEGDLELVQRILDNLIDNALRHAPEGSTVAISATVADSHHELRVADEGRGIPEELRREVFEPHFRVEQDAHASRSGQGLGLAYCRAAAQAHGGEILVEPTPVGATFCLRLPIVREEARA